MKETDTGGQWKLPFDIICEVIAQFWYSHQSNEERIQFMVSSSLVNKLWRRTFMTVSYKDMYIPCPRYVEVFTSMLIDDNDEGSACRSHDSSSSLSSVQSFKNSDLIPRQLCERINVLVENGIWPYSNIDCPQGNLPDRVVALLHDNKHRLPNLRNLNLEYWGITLYQIAYLTHKRVKLRPMDMLIDIRWTYSQDAFNMVTRWIEDDPGKIDDDVPRRRSEWWRYVASIRHMNVHLANVPLHVFRLDTVDFDVIEDWAPAPISESFFPLPSHFKQELLQRMFDTRLDDYRYVH